MSNYLYAQRRVHSTIALPELPSAPPQEPEFRISRLDQPAASTGAVDWDRSLTASPLPGGPRCSRSGGAYALSFPGIAEVWIPTPGDIQVWQHPDASADSVRHILLDHVMPRVLANTGALVLHASAAVTPKGACVVLLADSGSGKSTLAAAISSAGGELLSDDCLHMSWQAGRPVVFPICPKLRLWPDSLQAIFGANAAESESMAHNSSKRWMPTAARAKPSVTGTAVDAIYLLDPDDAAAGIEATPVAPAQACLALVRYSFRLELGRPAAVQGALAEAARIIAAVPVLSLRYRRDYATLPALVGHLDDAAISVKKRPALAE